MWQVLAEFCHERQADERFLTSEIAFDADSAPRARVERYCAGVEVDRCVRSFFTPAERLFIIGAVSKFI
ncbi:hypothetical protein AB0H83_34020 [Dactylosporangium sp. NPDC050688]|uniref:hypothetical protein n=1 Tax=Dactylosporangium sp. NPDC050688 TaxID=3157217 RepID=UPI0033C7E1CD